MNILFINIFFVGFMVSEIPIVSVFRTVGIRLLSPIYILLNYLISVNKLN